MTVAVQHGQSAGGMIARVGPDATVLFYCVIAIAALVLSVLSVLCCVSRIIVALILKN